MKHYNYIFAGAGLSALMTVYKMVKSGKFSDKTILLLDENSKKTNDRTWCFWEEKNETWDAIVTKKWNSALYLDQNLSVNIDLTPNKYNQIRSIDFYIFVFTLEFWKTFFSESPCCCHKLDESIITFDLS